MPRILLASGSPRRKDLLQAAGFEVIINVSHADETWPDEAPEQAAITIAKRKLEHITDFVVPALAADTVVMLNAEPLGKPKDRAHAIEMLSALSGKQHQVITGYCLKSKTQMIEKSVVSRVWFRELSLQDIERYIDQGESFDKAGAYAIQGIGGVIVDRIEGSFTNIMGLPMTEVLQSWKAFSNV